MQKTIGVAGCGSMGLPMAQCLASAGFQVIGFDVRPLGEFGDFSSQMLTDPVEFSTRADVLISVVRDAKQTDDLLFDEQAMLVHEHAPSTVVISSTLSPRYIRDLQSRLPLGVNMMDAPMSGAPYRAREGALTFMLGGERSMVDALMPMFEAMGNEIRHLGPVSHGMTVKVLNNYCAATGLAATRRVLEMADHLGVDKRRLLSVMKASSGSNWYADHIDEIDWSREAYSLDNTIGIVEKDVRAALDAISDETDSSNSSSNANRSWLLDEALVDGLQRLEELDLPDKSQGDEPQ